MQITADQAYASLIWSADVAHDDAMLAVIDRSPRLRHVKVDRLYVANNGYSIFPKLAGQGCNVFYDAKIIEVPSKLEDLAIVECNRARPWMINCMAGSVSGGPLEDEDPNKIEGLKRFADACRKVGVRPCAVTVLTSKQSKLFAKENGEFNGRTAVEQVLYYMEFLLECGFTDVVCSPNEVPAIRAESRFDGLELNTPGIRRASSSARDQARTNTPAAALKAGANRLVIGQDITNGGNPAQNIEDIVAEILAA
ncbi:MAG TPA: orotidine 5'-phosphate decarboxylase / HUMPS family protein [Candidatus Binatia bacterium]|nr:orotidine 5'-phosphate decarboxylase / HUMPS family protein [Candidatus Binatia bacterium]